MIMNLDRRGEARSEDKTIPSISSQMGQRLVDMVEIRGN